MMDTRFKRLFSEFRLKNIDLKNRIVFLPHFTALGSDDNKPTERLKYYFVERAKGGAGLIIDGNHNVHPSGMMAPRFVSTWREENIPLLRQITDEVHNYDAKIIGQLNHGGQDTLKNPPQMLWNPSQILEPSSSCHTMQMGRDEMDTITEAFTISAVNLKKSGYDGVEIKIAHDGLLRAFASPYFNRRTDKYGGSFENRLRYPLEVLESIRNAIGDIPFGVRLCMDEFTDFGYGLEYGIRMAELFEKEGLVDYINTDAGSFNSFYMEIPPMMIPLGFAEYMAAELKKHIKLPVVAFGRINDPVHAEQILENGSADLIGMCRQLVCDAETPNKAIENRMDDIRNCVACQEGCIHQVMQMEPIRCIQSMGSGNEKEYGMGTLDKVNKKKKVVVIGGGPAGLKFAEISAKRGHDVVIFEKDRKFGGQLNLVERLPFRNEMADIVRYLSHQVENNNVDVKLGTYADAEKISAQNPDVIVVATGSVPTIPEEYRNSKVCTVWDVLNDKTEIGNKIVIYDLLNSHQGLGVAEYLYDYFKNRSVKFFTPSYFAGSNVAPSNTELVYAKLYRGDIEFIPNHALHTVNENSLIFTNRFNQKEYAINGYDNLIYIGESMSCDDLYYELCQKFGEVYRIGDAAAPRMVELAIHEAERLARTI